MSQILPSFRLADFARYSWEDVLEQTDFKECYHYSTAFHLRTQEAEASGDSLAHEVFTFLSEITSNIMQLKEQADPLAGAKAHLDMLSDAHLDILRGLVAASDPEMRARIADILWVCKRDTDRTRPSEMAKIAIKSYLQSAETLEDIKNWMNCADRIERAAQLALPIDGKKDTTMRCLVVSHVDNLITRYIDVEPEFLTGSAMKVLQKYLRTVVNEPSKYAAIAAQKAAWGKAKKDYYQAVAYRQIESEWHKMAGDQVAARNARLLIAEADVWYTQEALKEPSPNYAVAAGRIGNAIKAFRGIEGTAAPIEQLRKQMAVYQQKSVSQMVFIPIAREEYQDTEMQKSAKDLVAGKTLRDALYSLAFGYRLIQTVDNLRSEAEQEAKPGSLLQIIPMVLVDKEGKTKAISGNGDDSIEETMFRNARFYQGWIGVNFVAPACVQSSSEHKVSLDDLSFIVDKNPFIPQGREPLFARGLLAGLQGDLVVAVHLLIPQLENSMRHILKLNGFIPSSLSSRMIQDEYTLNKVLELPDLKQILTEDIVFALKGLLVERMGSNSRNDVCHGLLDYNQLFSGQLLYLWWLTLYLCLYPGFKQWAAELANYEQL